MFACAMYPGNKEFLENVEKEARFNIKRLRNHPSIALWCGDNEILSAWNKWGWKENVLENQGQNIVDTVWEAYDKVFHNLLPNIVKELDPDKLYWSSSPSSGFGQLENGKSGDSHYWGVWWAKEPFAKYETEIPRFMSEFGFQSFPEFNSVKKYTISEDHDIYSEVMKSHQRSSIGNATIEEYMLRDYKKPKCFKSFLYVGQLLQAKGIKTGIEAHRRNMPHCMGSLYWQLNDCWPVASWSGIDYYGKWKAMHYMVKDAFKNTILSVEEKNDLLNLHIISDKISDTEAKLHVSITDFHGTVISIIEKDIRIKGNKSEVHITKNISELIKGHNKNRILLHAVVYDEQKSIIDEAIHYFAPPKDLNLSKPELDIDIIKVDDNEYSVILSTDVLAKNVYIQSSIQGWFSNNYFDMTPKSKHTVSYHCQEKEITPDKIRKSIKIMTLTDTY